MVMDENKCQGKMTFIGYCDRKPTVVRDGKPYCWQHDPERLRRKADEENKKRKAWYADLDRKEDERIARAKLLKAAGLEQPSNELLREIVDLGGIRTILDRIKQGNP
jgi:hypothetical protein